MRILITGSRDWTDRDAVAEALLEARESGLGEGRIVVVHGACPTGADAIAGQWARKWGWQVETHPPDWRTHGRAAGPLRNAEMVKAGADLCLAFIRNGSRGATGCARAAEAAGITTRRFVA